MQIKIQRQIQIQCHTVPPGRQRRKGQLHTRHTDSEDKYKDMFKDKYKDRHIQRQLQRQCHTEKEKKEATKQNQKENVATPSKNCLGDIQL